MKTQLTNRLSASCRAIAKRRRVSLSCPPKPTVLQRFSGGGWRRRKPLAFPLRLLWAAALVLPTFGAQAAVVLTTLHLFTGTNDGANPQAGLAQGSDGYFYGTTTKGGGTNGVGYGGYGTVFKISTNGELTTLYSFGTITNANGVALDGADPVAGLVQGSDGYFYATTEGGGTNGVEYGGYGTVFKISTTGALTSFYSFTGGNDSAHPQTGLVQGSDGSFYGTTSAGGTNGDGTVFKIGTTGALTALHSFTGGEDGGNPESGLVQGSDGYFYGTAFSGGNSNLNYGYGWGTVFKISADGLMTTLYSFTNGSDGGYPTASLVQGSDGSFYGTTWAGGTNGDGTVFKISTTGTLTTLHSFGGTDGEFPDAGLVQGSDGYFFGTTCGASDGGIVDPFFPEPGTVFKISANGALTSLYSFTGGSAGANPQAGLVQGSDCSFYGTTFSGGLGGAGTVFRLTIVPEFQAVTLVNNMLNLTWSTEAGGSYKLPA